MWKGTDNWMVLQFLRIWEIGKHVKENLQMGMVVEDSTTGWKRTGGSLEKVGKTVYKQQ